MRLTLLLALLLAAPGRGDGGESLLCAFTDAKGTIRVLAEDRALKIVCAREERSSVSVVADLKGLDGQIVEAKVVPFLEGFAIALVARREGACSYHYLVWTRPGSTPQLSPALFTEPGDPYRIAELLNPSGDALQILFSRGLLDPGPGGAAPLVRLFSDNCAAAPTGLVGGKSRLVDMTVAK